MKKLLIVVLICLLVFAGCSQKEEKKEGAEVQTQNEAGKTDIENKEESKDDAAKDKTTKDEENKEAKEEKKEEAADETKAEAVTIKVGVPKAPPALPLLYMMENQVLGDKAKIEMEIWDAPEKLIAMVQGGEHDFFAFPLTVISKLHNKGMDLKLMNVNTWGVTYFMTSDPEFKSWEDLRGKTVYVPLQSSPPDALTQYFMNAAGLEIGKDVTINYASMTEVAQLLISGDAEYATLIEPQVTRVKMQNPNVRVALAFEDEWKRVTETDTMIPNAGFGAMGKFVAEQPELTKEFQEQYKKALQWVVDNPGEAGLLAEKYLDLKSKLVEKAIPTMGLHFKTPQDASEELKMFYNLLFEFDPKMIGGKVPSEAMYYED